jgi:DNA-binding LacI/PurR family transcriptional regulator
MKGPTARSVANAAGVSPATVSNAYNRPERVSAGVRARVLAVAREQGYVPDPAARSLRTGQCGAIGVVLTVGLSYAFSDPYYVELLTGLAEVTERTSSGLLLVPIGPLPQDGDGDEDAAGQATAAVERAVIDGAVADGLPDDHPAVLALARRGVPLVQSSPTGRGRSVIVDDRAAGRALGEHLAALGHRDVAAVVATPGPPGELVTHLDERELYPYSRLRLAGLREGLGPHASVTPVSAGRNAGESGRVAATALLASGAASDAGARRRPTAVVADSDVQALRILDVARSLGLVPGRDLSVTGFDDLPAARDTGLTTVRQPIREKGRLMARMLLDPALTETRIVLPTELVVRASTGPVAARGRGGRDA